MEGKEYTDWMGFGARVKNSRNSIGMTSEKLAEISHRTENFILRIESGKKRCSIDTLYLLSQALNVSTDSLLKGDNVELKDYADREIIDNILNNCNEKQLKAIKEVLVAICYNFDNLNDENSNKN